jgi:nucleoside-diphosphate-sugar epimerase
MRVLVTGTDGYIGAQLAPLLCERDHQVVGLDTGYYCDGLLYGDAARGMTGIRRDVRRITEDDLRGFDAVMHLAELSNDPLAQRNPALTYEINYHASVALAQKCKAAGVRRFIYSSSCSVYGVGTAELMTEEAPLNPQTAYAECKALVERDVLPLADRTFWPTFLRNATAYGPSPRMRFDIVLNNLAGLAWTEGEIRMTSDGTPWRPLVHVLDICEAFACVLEAPPDVVSGQIYNVGDTEQNYRVRDIAEVVAAAFPGCGLTFGTSDGDNRSYRVAFDKIRACLPGFRCRRDAAVGARELRAVFEQTGMTREVFEFRAFTRLKQLDHLVSTRQVDDRLFWNVA